MIVDVMVRKPVYCAKGARCLESLIIRLVIFYSGSLERLPFSIRVLLEAAIRKCDGFYVKQQDVDNILNWEERQNDAEIPFSPARVLLQDFT